MLVLAGMNFERYLSVVHPTFHRNNVTKSSLKKYLVFVTFWSLFSLVLPFIQPQAFEIYMNVTIILFLTTAVYIYIMIYFNATVRRRQILRDSINQNKRFSHDIKLAKSCFILVACSILTYLPVPIVMNFADKEHLTGANLVAWRTWSNTLVLLNSSLNSLVFFWRNPLLRNEAKNVLKVR